MATYSDMLTTQSNNYKTVLDQYTQNQQNLQQQLPGIYAGYNKLSNDVTNTLGDQYAPAAYDITKLWKATSGSIDQGLINAGFGNSSVRGNMQNQNTYMAGKNYEQLAASLAAQRAGLQSNIGLSGQAAQLQGLGLQTQAASQFGNLLNANTTQTRTGSNLGGGGPQVGSMGGGSSRGGGSNYNPGLSALNGLSPNMLSDLGYGPGSRTPAGGMMSLSSNQPGYWQGSPDDPANAGAYPGGGSNMGYDFGSQGGGMDSPASFQGYFPEDF